MKISEAFVEINARMDKLNRGLRDAQARSERWSRKVSDAASRVANRGFKMVSGAVQSLIRWMKRLAVVGAAALVAVEVQALKLGMAMRETWNRFKVAFGNMEKQAKAWNREFARTMRLNESDAGDFLQRLYLIIKSQDIAEDKAYDMAKGLVRLGYDMSSFFNLKPDEAFEKITSALVGMPRPLQNLGIVIKDTAVQQWALNNGLVKSKSEMTEAHKVIGRYNLMLEKTGEIQGDLARTINSEANLTRQLSAEWKSFLETLGQASTEGGGFGRLLQGATELIQRLGRDKSSEIGSAWNTVFDKMAQRVRVLDKEIGLFLTTTKMGLLELEKEIKSRFPFTYSLLRAATSKEEWPLLAPETWAGPDVLTRDIEARQSMLEAQARKYSREIEAIWSTPIGGRGKGSAAPGVGRMRDDYMSFYNNFNAQQPSTIVGRPNEINKRALAEAVKEGAKEGTKEGIAGMPGMVMAP